jgi:hypothetical protein
MKLFILIILPFIARLHPMNWNKDGWKYPQLWYCVPKKIRIIRTPSFPYGVIQYQNQKKRFFLQWLCGQLTGHEISITEMNNTNHIYKDCNCRWCDKLIRIHISEIIISQFLLDIVKMTKKHKKGSVIT